MCFEFLSFDTKQNSPNSSFHSSSSRNHSFFSSNDQYSYVLMTDLNSSPIEDILLDCDTDNFDNVQKSIFNSILVICKEIDDLSSEFFLLKEDLVNIQDTIRFDLCSDDYKHVQISVLQDNYELTIHELEDIKELKTRLRKIVTRYSTTNPHVFLKLTTTYVFSYKNQMTEKLTFIESVKDILLQYKCI